MLKTFEEALMSAKADVSCGPPYDERTSQRHGYGPWEWDTRATTVELAIPKLRHGKYCPNESRNTGVEPYKRSFRSLPPPACWACRPGEHRTPPRPSRSKAGRAVGHRQV